MSNLTRPDDRETLESITRNFRSAIRSAWDDVMDSMADAKFAVGSAIRIGEVEGTLVGVKPTFTNGKTSLHIDIVVVTDKGSKYKSVVVHGDE